MARIVMVHGAFGGAWCWERVAPELRAAGHSVETFDLPGSGDDRTPVEEVTLDAYAGRVCGQLATSDEPAVLVGHSMGGMAITQASGRCRRRIAMLVYVAAFLPREGQTLIDLTHLPEGEGDQVQANMTVEGDPPVATLAGAAARDALYACCDDAQAAWATERLRPQAVAPFAAPLKLADPGAQWLPRAYVLCSRDRAIPPALQRRMSTENECDEVIEIDTDHSPWLSATGELVNALNRLARTVVAPSPAAR